MDEQLPVASLNGGQESNQTARMANHIALDVLRGICFFGIIVTAMFGNCLVLIAVTKFKRIRQVRTNIFLVSLALADFLVALLVMPFNAILALMHGRWVFGSVFCDVFNANDVLFSTASILHLCCISTERYIAVLNPLSYERKMTRTRIAVMLTVTWLLSILISYVPILTGIHTTLEYKNATENKTEICEFVVNPYYAIVSSSTSFWIPSILMIAVYVRIFIEARNQERKIQKLRVSGKRRQSLRNRISQPNADYGANLEADQDHLAIKTNYSVPRETVYFPENTSLTSEAAVKTPKCTRKTASLLSYSTSSVDQVKIRRENKAAKTLGIIMGAFLLCWLPFFLWYTITNLCGRSQRCKYPEVVGDVMFWIGYFNSTLNPMIYAFYNRTFRNAFKQILMCKGRFSSRSFGIDTGKGRRTTFAQANANGVETSQQSSRP